MEKHRNYSQRPATFGTNQANKKELEMAVLLTHVYKKVTS
jgi:hypothetical protein